MEENKKAMDAFIEVIKKAGDNNTELAKKMDVSRASLYLWLKHRHSPSLDQAEYLLDLLGYKLVVEKKEDNNSNEE